MPVHPLHHHFQQTPVTCGPAVARMLVEARLGQSLHEADLARCFGTDARGTRPGRLAQGLRCLGFDVAQCEGGSLDGVARALGEGADVVVCYALPERGVDHYALVTSVDHAVVRLCDPIFGPDRPWSRCCFTERWHATTTTPDAPGGWWLAVRCPTQRP